VRRILIIGTALAVLAGAASASAASFNNYAGSGLKFSPTGAGTPAHPRIVNMTETLRANAPAGDRAAPLTDIKLKVYGVRTNGNLFPTCTDSQIEANIVKYERACAPKSRVAQGPVHSALGPSSNPSQSAGTACNPYLKVFNGGKSSQVFFFTTAPDAPSQYTCAGLSTGSTAPYDGHISYQGKYWVLDVPLPPDISNKVANQPGLYASLLTEVLSPISESTKVAGTTRGYMESVACQGGKRPYSITFTAQDYGTGARETQTVSGAAAC
jgi:hypothetical protein